MRFPGPFRFYALLEFIKLIYFIHRYNLIFLILIKSFINIHTNLIRHLVQRVHKFNDVRMRMRRLEPIFNSYYMSIHKDITYCHCTKYCEIKSIDCKGEYTKAITLNVLG